MAGRRKPRCIKCTEFEPIGNVGECRKYRWLISIQHAERDRVCVLVDENKR